MTKFLLLLGPSGVGKTSIINELKRLDDRFDYISPYITRPLRNEEKDKVSVTNEIMDEMNNRGMFLAINEKYGIRYATPRIPIVQALENSRFPVLDWPISKLGLMREAFPGKLLAVYIEPPSLNDLRERLGRDGRDIDGTRYNEAVVELARLWNGDFDGQYDLRITSKSDEIHSIGERIYCRYLESFCEGNPRGKEIG